MGKRGQVVIPLQFRRGLGLRDGELLPIEESDGGFLLRPASALSGEASNTLAQVAATDTQKGGGNQEIRNSTVGLTLGGSSTTGPAPTNTVWMGKRGQVVIPLQFRLGLRLENGALLLIEESDGGFLLRPALALSREGSNTLAQAALNAATAPDGDRVERYVEVRRAVTGLGFKLENFTHEPLK
jgi:AbrB family looped-hinge helix DNA binding protein